MMIVATIWAGPPNRKRGTIALPSRRVGGNYEGHGPNCFRGLPYLYALQGVTTTLAHIVVGWGVQW